MFHIKNKRTHGVGELFFNRAIISDEAIAVKPEEWGSGWEIWIMFKIMMIFILSNVFYIWINEDIQNRKERERMLNMN